MRGQTILAPEPMLSTLQEPVGFPLMLVEPVAATVFGLRKRLIIGSV